MKLLLIIIVTLICSATITVAQNLPQPGGGCSIKFNYDNAGNRVKRYYDCTDPIGPNGTDTVNGDTGPVIIGQRVAKNESIHGGDINVSIFPNPTTEKFTVAISQVNINSLLRLYDAGGRLVQEWKMNNAEQIFDIGNLASGVYQLTVSIEEKNYIFKIVKR